MNVMVVSPHPDDETLGAGGTLLKLKRQGHKIFWLNITDMKVEDGWDESYIKRRQIQIDSINTLYGFNGFYNLKFAPARLSSVNEGDIIREIRTVFDLVKPEWLIIPGQYDAHSDHHVTYNCCMACAKTFRAPYINRIITMEIISETDYGFQKEKFEPNLFVDISNELDGKIKAMKIYDTEIEKIPFPRNLDNIRAHAISWGGLFVKNMQKLFA